MIIQEDRKDVMREEEDSEDVMREENSTIVIREEIICV